jgi:hypothetical protein
MTPFPQAAAFDMVAREEVIVEDFNLGHPLAP